MSQTINRSFTGSISGRVLLLALACALFFSLIWARLSVHAGNVTSVGRITAMPTGSLIGAWTIGGVNFVSTDATDIRQDKGALAVGGCAEVEYVGAAQPFTATKIASKAASDCSGGTETSTPGPTTTGTPNATPAPGNEQESTGLVASMPANGFVGTWVVNGTSYSTTSSTEFKQRNGPLMVGACVKVHYTSSGAALAVREIETAALSDCNGTSATPSATPNGTATVTPGTVGELYGVLQSFPAGLIGNWNIGGMTFVASASTQFKQERGAFAVGVTVKVHFSVDGSGVNQASEIETKVANERGNDDNGNGSVEGAEGHAFATIDSFPAGLTGDWSIGGIAYQATASTVFAQNDGAFAVGAKVKVEYFLNSSGARVARQIETTSDTGDATIPTHFKLFGFVKAMPVNGRIGQWTVDNSAFVTDANTQFKENNGLLGVGAYVAVEYSQQGGQNLVHEIETHIPPGAGANFLLGTLDDKGGALQAAARQAITWKIGGVNYTVSAATALNAVQGGLDVGKTVLVNSYTAADGSQVATQISGITITSRVYLPLTRR
ncbi:MAG: DUF5666 domain-containing protein [Caldilineaceae bacterium]